jgi:hypothetical protein
MVTQVFTRGAAYFAYTSTIEKRERAKMLALSGVELAMSQLYVKKPEQKKGEGGKGAQDKKGGQPAQKPNEVGILFQQIFPVLNRWQSKTFNSPQQGLDGEIKFYIACEDGKLNLNNLYDFEKQQFKGNKQEQELFRKTFLGKLKSVAHIDGDLFIGLEKLFKKNRLNDVTQLLERPEYHDFINKVFIKPGGQDKPDIVLTDIFTTWTQEQGVNPWFFSQSMDDLFGLQGAARDSINARKEAMKNWTKLFKPQASWQKDWDTTLGKVYGVQLKTLPQKVDSMFLTKFVPKTFSVVSYGIVGEITQKVFAIVVRSGNSNDTYGDVPYKIVKLYWI